MKYVIIFSLLLFNILLLSVAMKFHPKENHPCPGVFEKLKELVAAGDDLDAVAQAMEGCRRGFSEEANMILSIMVQLDRHRSFRYLFNLSALNSQVNVPDFRQLWFRGYKFGFFLEALIAHRHSSRFLEKRDWQLLEGETLSLGLGRASESDPASEY